MNPIYLSRSIRSRALELMKNLDVDKFGITFESGNAFFNFKKLLEETETQTLEIGHPFLFTNIGFKYFFRDNVHLPTIIFTKSNYPLPSMEKIPVFVSMQYFIDLFPNRDHYFIKDILKG